MGNDFAGVGFGVDYVRNKANFGYYYSVAPEWVLSLTGEAGDIFGWNGQQVLIQDRFFVGGDNLRGFQSAGIGPRDSVSGDALGGQKYYLGSVTLGVPLGLPKELGISGRVFTDFGTLYHIEPTNIVLTPAQLAQTGGRPAASPAVPGNPPQRRGRSVVEIPGWSYPTGRRLSDPEGRFRQDPDFQSQLRDEVLMSLRYFHLRGAAVANLVLPCRQRRGASATPVAATAGPSTANPGAAAVGAVCPPVRT